MTAAQRQEMQDKGLQDTGVSTAIFFDGVDGGGSGVSKPS